MVAFVLQKQRWVTAVDHGAHKAFNISSVALNRRVLLTPDEQQPDFLTGSLGGLLALHVRAAAECSTDTRGVEVLRLSTSFLSTKVWYQQVGIL